MIHWPADRIGLGRICASTALAAACSLWLSPGFSAAQTASSAGPGLYIPMQYGAGWNMIGLANTPFNPSAGAMFPAAASPLFKYSNGYIFDSVLHPGIGYWIKLDAPRNAQHPGVWLALPQTISLAAGWNLICSGASEPAPVASIVAAGTTLQSNFFGFNEGYYIATTIDPGHAYWVKSATRGAITFNR